MYPEFSIKIGFRCSPKSLLYVVLKGTQGHPEIVEIKSLKMPKNYSWVQRLTWVRREIIDLIDKFSINGLACKRPELTAKRQCPERIQIEGIIMESANSKNIDPIKYYLKSQIKRDLDFDKHTKYLTNKLKNTIFEKYIGTGFEEAILAAWCLLKK